MTFDKKIANEQPRVRSARPAMHQLSHHMHPVDGLSHDRDGHTMATCVHMRSSSVWRQTWHFCRMCARQRGDTMCESSPHAAAAPVSPRVAAGRRRRAAAAPSLRARGPRAAPSQHTQQPSGHTHTHRHRESARRREGTRASERKRAPRRCLNAVQPRRPDLDRCGHEFVVREDADFSICPYDHCTEVYNVQFCAGRFLPRRLQR